MAIEYKAIAKKVIGGADKGQTKYYASANITGKSGIDEITEDIEQASTVNGADIRAVLYGLLETVPKYLKDGNSVELPGIGIFRITISSQAEDTAKEVTAKSIKNAKILFKPNKDFNKVLDDLSFKKID